MRRTGICGATETLLIDAAIAPRLLPMLIAELRELGCDFRADAKARAIIADLQPATETDFDTEWLDAILSVRVVDGIDQALAHIAHHGSEHTDAIVTEDSAAAERFLRGIDSAVGIWNASTQFCDGGEFGFGAEIGIATGSKAGMAPFADRLASARAVADGRRVVATGIEAKLGTRYSVDTLRVLQCLFPRAEFIWVMGADILEELPRWRRWLDLAARVPLAVLPRETFNQRALAGHSAHRLHRGLRRDRQAPVLARARPPAWIFLRSPQHPASASAIRAARKGGAS
jgi:nicotinic acid mononucleotide adenylyltransferase